MDILLIPPQQTKVLELLGQYKFLTISQMIRLGVSTNRDNLQKVIKEMRQSKRELVKSLTFGIIPKKGRLENVHYLTPKGKAVLVEDLHYQDEDIKLPKGRNSLFYRDYFHRKNTIDIEIAFNLWADTKGIDIVFFDRYFDKIGNNRTGKNLRAKTKFDLKNDKYLIADGACMLETKKGNKLYCIEMYNGRDTKRVYKQLRQYLEALEIGSPSDSYNHDRGFRVLCVFEYSGCMEATIQRVKDSPSFDNVREYYLFKTLESVNSEDLHTGWADAKGEYITLY